MKEMNAKFNFNIFEEKKEENDINNWRSGDFKAEIENTKERERERESQDYLLGLSW